jgi:hypothetical protein
VVELSARPGLRHLRDRARLPERPSDGARPLAARSQFSMVSPSWRSSRSARRRT